MDGDCGITCWGEDGGGTGGGGGGGGCGLTCAGMGGNGSDPGTIPTNTGDGNPPNIPIDTTNLQPLPTPGNCDGPCSPPQQPPSPEPPLVAISFIPPPGPGSSGGGSSSVSGNPNNPNNPPPKRQVSCGSSLVVLGIGTVFTAGAVVALVYAPELAPEIYEGAEGAMTMLHLIVPVVSPGLVMSQGAQMSWSNCHP